MSPRLPFEAIAVLVAGLLVAPVGSLRALSKVPLVVRRMKLIFVLGAIVLAVIMAALTTGTTHADDENCVHCPTETHQVPGRYRLYVSTPDDHVHPFSKGGISNIVVTKVANAFNYQGTIVTVSEDQRVFAIDYTAAAGGTIAVDFHTRLGLWDPIRLDGQTNTSPPQNQNPPPQNNPPQNPQQQGVNNPPTLTGTTTLQHAENDTTPVATYTADDPENGNIVWDLSGTDGADFSIINGDLTFNAGPDYEDPADADEDNVYHVTVEASDGTNTGRLDVTVTVTNVNEAPQFPGSTATRSVLENTAAGQNIGVPVEATDPEGDTLTYSLGGTDASSFSIDTSTGQLLTKGALGNSSYSVTVSVTDGKDVDGNSDTATDDTVDVTIDVTSSTSGTSTTTLLNAIPRQFVPINGGPKTIVLSDHFADSDSGYPPYVSTISDSAIATVEVSDGSLVITPEGIGVATTTVTVTDSPGIREVFKTIVYRPVVPRTSTETVHIVDPEVETTLTSSDGRLSVTLPAGAKDQFYQVAIDALSNDCGRRSPIGEQRLCVLVDLFDLAAESIEESLNVAATLSVSLTQQQYNSVQTDLDNGDFTMWKGHGPSDTSWDEIPECDDPPGSSECFNLIQTSDGGKITVINIRGFSQFDAGLLTPDPTPQPPPTKPSPPATLPGGSGGSDSGDNSRGDESDSRYRSGPTLRVLGPVRPEYPENGTDAIARYTIEDSDVEGVVWSVYGDRKSFVISGDGVLSFRSPPDYEDPSGTEGNTYWAQVYAEAIDSPSRNNVLNVYVTVTPVNELGAISGHVELSTPENHTGAIAQYEVDDPERGSIAWSLSGPDASGFEIDSEGNLSPAGVLDFEAPSSSALSNVHTLTITATDNGRPQLSAQVDITVTVDDVNEAPVAAALPAVDLTTEQVPWTLDLGDFFTDPDGDSLAFEVAGESGTDVAEVSIDGGILSIAPVGGGAVSFEVAATDPGGLRAASAVSVSVTDTTPVSTPTPAKVTESVPTATPAPAKETEPAPIETPAPANVTEPALTEPSASVIQLMEVEPTLIYVPLSERRYRNMPQQSDGVSKVIVAFAVEPVESQPSELALLPLEAAPTPAPARLVTVVDDAAAVQGQSRLPATVDEAGGGLSLWAVVLLILAGLAVAGYVVRTIVVHRVSNSIWQGLSQMRQRLLPAS